MSNYLRTYLWFLIVGDQFGERNMFPISAYIETQVYCMFKIQK